MQHQLYIDGRQSPFQAFFSLSSIEYGKCIYSHGDFEVGDSRRANDSNELSFVLTKPEFQVVFLHSARLLWVDSTLFVATNGSFYDQILMADRHGQDALSITESLPSGEENKSLLKPFVLQSFHKREEFPKKPIVLTIGLPSEHITILFDTSWKVVPVKE